MKTARQVVVQAVTEWLERGDIEEMARALRQLEDGILSPNDRTRMEEDLGLWRFGKWALLGDTGPGQRLKALLEYRARVKESPTFWASIVPMTDDEAAPFDALMCQLLTLEQRRAIQCTYQYHQSEDAGARLLKKNRYDFRVIRDTAIRKLCEAVQTA
jgi:hypothetical protein